MKSLNSILFLILSIISTNTVISQQVTFRGNIKIDRTKLTARDDTLRLRPVTSIRYPEKDTIWSIKIPINSDGSFNHVATEILDSTIYEYDYWWLPNIYLTRNTEVDLSVEVMKAEETYQLKSSKAVNENKYLVHYKWGRAPYPAVTEDPKNFTAGMDSVLEVEQERLKTFNVDRRFTDIMSDQLKIDWGDRHFYYLTANDGSNRDRIDSSTYFNFISEVPIQNVNSARIFASHLDFIDGIVDYLLESVPGNDSKNLYQYAIQLEKILEKDISEIYLANLFIRTLLHSGESDISQLTSFVEYYRNTFPDSEYLGLMDYKLNKRISEVFTLTIYDERLSRIVYDTSGNTVILGQLLKSHLGKVVLLDIWASSCQPCIAQIPKLKNLQESYRDDGLVVISLSVEGTAYMESHWKKCIKRNSWEKWNHILSQGMFESEILKIFDSNSLPTYVIIDKEGKVHLNMIQLKDYSSFHESIKELL